MKKRRYIKYRILSNSPRKGEVIIYSEMECGKNMYIYVTAYMAKNNNS